MAVASELVGSYLDEHWSSQDIDRAVLSVGEAISNSVEHGDGPIQLSFVLEDGVFVLEVSDQGTGPPEDRLSSAVLPARFEESGRGLFILHALADSVSVVVGGRLRVTISASV